MLKDFFPKGHQRYSSLPILGLVLDGFTEFLSDLGYPRYIVRRHIQSTCIIDFCLREHGCCSIKKITRATLKFCAPKPGHSQDNISAAAAVMLLERYFDNLKILPPPNPPSPLEEKIIEYHRYLDQVRGFSISTINDHCRTVSEFISGCGGLPYLKKLTSKDIENFICKIGKRFNRGSLQHVIAHIRAFLRYLIMRNEAPMGLDAQIDTPCVYREEQLPRSLDWRTVQTIIQSIDRSTAIGKRDYAMLLLVTTYGLRASDVVSLKLDDIDWRKNIIQIFQHKTTTPLLLPLTEAVGESIVEYLRRGRPQVSFREIFSRCKAPNGPIKPTTMNEAFKCWVRRSGLLITFQGSHCLRHSYAVHLLRQGTPLKTIGDLLGHRDFESTCVYLRLNIEDLRAVPLSLPILAKSKGV
jgi:site-specific recombinase XerD